MQLPIKTIRDATEAIRQYLGGYDLDDPFHPILKQDIEDLFSEIDEKLSQIESSSHYLTIPFHEEKVDLFAMGYTWTCHECSNIHTVPITSYDVYCPDCCVKFKVDEVNHNK